MGNIKERVLNVLKKVPATRKSDNVLMAHLWLNDAGRLRSNFKNEETFRKSYYFLKLLRNGKLTNWESATRVRRQLQAKYPELRDKDTYEKRMQRSVEFRQEFSNRYNFEGRE